MISMETLRAIVAQLRPKWFEPTIFNFDGLAARGWVVHHIELTRHALLKATGETWAPDKEKGCLVQVGQAPETDWRPAFIRWLEDKLSFAPDDGVIIEDADVGILNRIPASDAFEIRVMGLPIA